jgi:hypothetical protein
VTLTCGLTGYPRRRFAVATAVAAVIWALYAFFIGRLGGQVFEDNPWAGLVIAFAASIAISAVIEAIRRLLAHRRGRASAEPARAKGRAGVFGPSDEGKNAGPGHPEASGQAEHERPGDEGENGGYSAPEASAGNTARAEGHAPVLD